MVRGNDAGAQGKARMRATTPLAHGANLRAGAGDWRPTRRRLTAASVRTHNRSEPESPPTQGTTLRIETGCPRTHATTSSFGRAVGAWYGADGETGRWSTSSHPRRPPPRGEYRAPAGNFASARPNRLSAYDAESLDSRIRISHRFSATTRTGRVTAPP
jgi:hypothetical protein